jgi:hypothetical protein
MFLLLPGTIRKGGKNLLGSSLKKAQYYAETSISEQCPLKQHHSHPVNQKFVGKNL